MFSYIVDCLFLLDILVVFNTAYLNQYLQIVDDRKTIAIKYFKGWFLIDVLSILPFDLLAQLMASDDSESTAQGYNGMIRLVKVGRLYKLIKLTKLIRIFKLLTASNKFLKFFQE